MRAIFAGRGALPGLLLEAGPAEIVAFRGAEPDLAPTLPARFEQLGTLFDALHGRGVTEICLAGAMRRPDLDPVALDPFTAERMPVLMAAMAQGDDGLLRAVLALIEEAGFDLRGAHEIRPDLTAPPGVICGTDMGGDDASRARAVLDALGPLDVGQAVVVARGQVLGIETLQGTDAMLDFVAATAPGSEGILLKRPKPGQDLRVDMPAIGPETIKRAAAAGLRGIEIAAGAVLLLDRAAIEAACAETGLNLWAAGSAPISASAETQR